MEAGEELFIMHSFSALLSGSVNYIEHGLYVPGNQPLIMKLS